MLRTGRRNGQLDEPAPRLVGQAATVTLLRFSPLRHATGPSDNTPLWEIDCQAILFHSTLLQFAAHYRYEPRPVAPYRGNEKARVERKIRYLRNSFWPARTWSDLDDLNAAVRAWCVDVAAKRPCPEDDTIGSVGAERG